MNWKGVFGFGFVALGLVLTIISMATLQWVYVSSGSSNCGYGLVQQRCCTGGNCSTKTIDETYPTGKLAASGGKKVLACGIVSLFVAAAGFILAFMARKKASLQLRNFAIAAWLASGALAILAVILYSKKTVLLDYAFILYLFSSFTALLGCTIILAGPGVGGVGGVGGTKE